jgi:hypothetical protein
MREKLNGSYSLEALVILSRIPFHCGGRDWYILLLLVIFIDKRYQSIFNTHFM